MALAHTVSSKVEQAYRRGDLFEKKRQLAEAWAQYCEGSEPSENVVRLAGVRAERGAGALGWSGGGPADAGERRFIFHSSGKPALRRPTR